MNVCNDSGALRDGLDQVVDNAVVALPRAPQLAPWRNDVRICILVDDTRLESQPDEGRELARHGLPDDLGAFLGKSHAIGLEVEIAHAQARCSATARPELCHDRETEKFARRFARVEHPHDAGF